jgi:hypothetical protein
MPYNKTVNKRKESIVDCRELQVAEFNWVEVLINA